MGVLQPPVPGLGLNFLSQAPQHNALATLLGMSDTDVKLALALTPMPVGQTALAEAMSRVRRREAWNSVFATWAGRASATEQATLGRAERLVRQSLTLRPSLLEQGVRLHVQGSQRNNTNGRHDADIDLRVQLPLVRLEHGPGVIPHHANVALGYSFPYPGVSTETWAQWLRDELVLALIGQFGGDHVEPGNKAIHVKGVTGSRAKIDVVPAVGYHLVNRTALGGYVMTEGVAIYSRSGEWTANFPDQHHRNGIIKRNMSGYQFKKIVRIMKRLRADMEKRGFSNVKVPSYLVECIVYVVEDAYFAVDGDDMYGRVRRVAHRAQALLSNPLTAARLREINGIKPLFSASQAWGWHDALSFINAAVNHLGDA